MKTYLMQNVDEYVQLQLYMTHTVCGSMRLQVIQELKQQITCDILTASTNAY